MHPSAAARMIQILKLLLDDEIEMFMPLRNLATLLAAMHEQPPKPSMRNYLGVDDLCKIRWSDTLYAVRDAIPDIAMTVWSNEDTPLIWPQVICGIAGLE